MSRRLGTTALGVLVAVAPVVVWWLVGDLSFWNGDYYMMKAPAVFDSFAAPAAAGAVALGVAAVVVVILARRELIWMDAGVTAPLILASAYVGFAYRVLTAAVVGANIGGGLVLMFGMVFVPSMAAVSSLCWVAKRRQLARTQPRCHVVRQGRS